eukprot:3454400-Pyramimonas_sp.AAC.1
MDMPLGKNEPHTQVQDPAQLSEGAQAWPATHEGGEPAAGPTGVNAAPDMKAVPDAGDGGSRESDVPSVEESRAYPAGAPG